MKMDIILAGVGGQGIVSISYVIDMVAMKNQYHVKQSEVHGMSQRGGAVQAHVRISDKPIMSDLIPMGKADLILGVEPMETLRYAQFLSPTGTVICNSQPFVNISNYPPIEDVLEKLGALPQQIILDSASIAKFAGNRRAENMVMIGAALYLLPFPASDIELLITDLFKAKGEKIVELNIKAFHYGMELSEFYRSCLKAGMSPVATLTLAAHMQPGTIVKGVAEAWSELFKAYEPALISALKVIKTMLPGSLEVVAQARSAITMGEEEFKSAFAS